MAITRISSDGPVSASSGTLSVTWTTTPAAGNTLVMNVFALAGQVFPDNISGWTTVFTNGSGGGYVSAQYVKTALGTESGSQTVLTATTACIAGITEYKSSLAYNIVTATPSYGGDSDDSATGVVTPSVTAPTTVAANWIETATVWAASSPSFPTVPAAVSGQTISQTGATLGTQQNRGSAVWQTNHRYNLSDRPVTSGATGTIQYASNSATANLRGISNLTVLSETPVSQAALVGQATSQNGTSSTTLSYSSTAGNTLVALVINQGADPLSIVDSNGTTWPVVAASANDGGTNQRKVALAFIVNSPAISSITATQNSSANLEINLSEWSGVVYNRSYDDLLGAQSKNMNTPQLPALGGDLVIGAVAYFSGTNADITTAASAYTKLNSPLITSQAQLVSAYTLLGTAATTGPSFTSTTSLAYGGVTAVFSTSTAGSQQPMLGV